MKKLITSLFLLTFSMMAFAQMPPAHTFYWYQLNDDQTFWDYVEIEPLTGAAEGILRFDSVTQSARWSYYGPRIKLTGDTLDVVQPDWLASSSSPAAIKDQPKYPVIGAPTTRTIALGTAYRCTDIAKPCKFTISLQATSGTTVTGVVNNEAVFTIGSTSGVATGTGTNLAVFKNNIDVTLLLGVAVRKTQATSTTIEVPVGWYIAVRQTVGTGVTVVSAFDQAWSI